MHQRSYLHAHGGTSSALNQPLQQQQQQESHQQRHQQQKQQQQQELQRQQELQLHLLQQLLHQQQLQLQLLQRDAGAAGSFALSESQSDPPVPACDGPPGQRPPDTPPRPRARRSPSPEPIPARVAEPAEVDPFGGDWPHW
jgi:hypothetical protein